MKKQLLSLFALGILFFGLNGCASTGLTASSHHTNVELSAPNYEIIAVNVTGEASSSALFGCSYGLGLATSQMALIPLTSDRAIYKNAMEDLWESFEDTNGSVEGKKLALVNLRYDSYSVNTFIFTKVTTVIVADVVEFKN